MSNPNIPGVDAMYNSVDFIKKMWTDMGVPGMVVPIISVEEIDKKITDLKAVEGWLSLNLNMLRTTIQALEVQSATLSALKSMGAMNMSTASSSASAASAGSSTAESAADGAAAWAAMASQFPFSFMTERSKAADETPPQPAVEPIVAPEPARDQEPAQQKSASDQPADMPDTQSPFANSGAWWDVLQNQFKQVVSSVMATEAAIQKTPIDAPKSTAKPSAIPKVKATPVKTRAKAGTKASPKTAARSVPKAPPKTEDAKSASAPRNKKAVTK